MVTAVPMVAVVPIASALMAVESLMMVVTSIVAFVEAAPTTAS